MGSLPGVVCEFCNRWFPNAQVYGGHKSRRTPCQGLSAVARPSRSAPSAGLHALLFVHDILSDAPAAPASPTASNASNTDGVNGPPRVPVADEDATPSAVNVGAPESEHQPSPETPADDTSEHQGCRPGVSHAAPPTIISGESNATPLSPIALKLLHFVRRVNGGMGMAEIDINGLLQLVVEPGLAPLVISEIRNCKDLERFEMERLVGLNRGWSVATFEIEGHPPNRLLFQNSAQAFAELFGHTNNAPGFKLKARVDEDPDTGERRYTTPETGTWWNDAQEHFGWSEVVGGIILYSDVTHMSNNGRKKAWPLMMTLANISQAKRWGKAGHTLLALLPIPPSAMTAVEKVMLFQRCVITVLQPLLDGMDRVVLAVAVPTLPVPRSGLRLKDPFGDWQTVRPLLYAWVCDYPESGKISCTLSHGSRMPCSICYAAKEHLVAVKARNTPRTPEQQQWIVNEAAGLTSSQADPCKTYSTYPVEVMVFVFAGLLRQPQMDAVRAYLGWYLLCCQPTGHTERSLRDLKKKTSRLVEQLQAAFPKQPSSWCLVKTHLMSHYIDSIRRAGHVTEFSTNMFEHLHGPLVKRIYRRSNKRNVDGQIMKFHARRIPDVVPVDDPLGRDTAMRQAIETGTRTLIKESYLLPVELPEEPTSTNWFARKWAMQHPVAQAALKDALVRYAGCAPKIRAHASLAIPAADDASFSRVSHFVRATPDYFERPWYSDVAVEGVRYGRREEWYARLLLLFHTKIRGEREELAYVRYWNACGEDAATGCTRLKWTTGVYAYSVIPLEALLRHVHVVKAFHLDSTYLLNKYHM
ncbi:unnamed protein product [Closterium sp. Yama58-4]|nr:unnamed protein product [Closterium sp. Yama58-4]